VQPLWKTVWKCLKKTKNRAPRCPTTDEWIKKMWYLYTIKFHSDIEKNETLSFEGKWMELEKNHLKYS
jgi:hypothetical protein